MKAKELIEILKQCPEAEVMISTDTFIRKKIEGTATCSNDITLCSYSLLEIINSQAVPMIDDNDDFA